MSLAAARGLGGWLLAAWLAWAPAALAASAELEPFFGTYVGRAELTDLASGRASARDLDVVIAPFREAGFRIDWINVSLVDGRRDQAGVKRWAQSALFQPAAGRDFYVEVEPANPFRKRAEPQPIGGDPLRWARIAGPALQVFAFQLLPDGHYELQIYERVLTADGLDIRFERIVDDRPVRRLTGHVARAQAGGLQD